MVGKYFTTIFLTMVIILSINSLTVAQTFSDDLEQKGLKDSGDVVSELEDKGQKLEEEFDEISSKLEKVIDVIVAKYESLMPKIKAAAANIQKKIEQMLKGSDEDENGPQDSSQ